MEESKSPRKSGVLHWSCVTTFQQYLGKLGTPETRCHWPGVIQLVRGAAMIQTMNYGTLKAEGRETRAEDEGREWG